MTEESSMDVKMDENFKININYYRKLVRRYLELHRYKTALFWADKVYTLSKGNEYDAYWLAQCMYLSKQYHRAAHLIKSRNLHQSNLQCCYLAASSLMEAKEYTEAMEMLYEPCSNNEGNKTMLNATASDALTGIESEDIILQGNCLVSAMHYEQGRVYEAMDNRELATDCYRQALMADVHCFEALDSLVQHQMLSSLEEMKLTQSLPFSKHCPTDSDEQFVRVLYESKLNKYRSLGSGQADAGPVVQALQGNLDLMVSEAETHYYNCNYMACWKVTQEVVSRDPYHVTCLPVHISCLVELKNANDLFLLAHRLVDIYPESAVSWFAVGCYYYVIRKSDPARRFLGKATSLDKLFGPAWLAYGHSFAAENEHDQAMAAYFKASQLMKGCHLPLLYIGLENGLTNNSNLAEKFFLQAQAIAPSDPFVSHEMGVIAFQSGQYETARKHLEEALERVRASQRTMVQTKWEPLLNNLGHVYRKLQLYDKAIDFHMQAMVLAPDNPSSYAAIGYCRVLLGDCHAAAEMFHKALSLKRDDTFSTTMLNYVLEQLIDEYSDGGDLKLSVGKDTFDCDYLIQSGNAGKQNLTPMPALIPLEDEAEAETEPEAEASEANAKTPSSRPEDSMDGSKLSFEVDMLESTSQTYDSP